MIYNKVLGLDLETTGVTSYDTINQIGLVMMTSDGEVVSQYHSRVRIAPRQKISLEAIGVQSGVDVAELDNEQALALVSAYLKTAFSGSPAKAVAADVAAWCEEHDAKSVPVVAHNAGFDHFFWRELEFQQKAAMGGGGVLSATWIDTMTLAKHVFGRAPRAKFGLDECLVAVGLDQRPGAHDALEDARLAAMLFFKLQEMQSRRAEPSKEEDFVRTIN